MAFGYLRLWVNGRMRHELSHSSGVALILSRCAVTLNSFPATGSCRHCPADSTVSIPSAANSQSCTAPRQWQLIGCYCLPVISFGSRSRLIISVIMWICCRNCGRIETVMLLIAVPHLEIMRQWSLGHLNPLPIFPQCRVMRYDEWLIKSDWKYFFFFEKSCKAGVPCLMRFSQLMDDLLPFPMAPALSIQRTLKNPFARWVPAMCRQRWTLLSNYSQLEYPQIRVLFQAGWSLDSMPLIWFACMAALGEAVLLARPIDQRWLIHREGILLRRLPHWRPLENKSLDLVCAGVPQLTAAMLIGTNNEIRVGEWGRGWRGVKPLNLQLIRPQDATALMIVLILIALPLAYVLLQLEQLLCNDFSQVRIDWR